MLTCLIAFFTYSNGFAQIMQYKLPDKSVQHEGTWLQWPHNKLYGPWYRFDVEPTWIKMTKELHTGEKVHIIAFDSTELAHIQSRLMAEGIPLSNIDFYIYKTNDVWVRDSGPMFVYDTTGQLTILDWGFNGWGMDYPFRRCDTIPSLVSQDLALPLVNLSEMVLEGGAIEHDGKGTMMATRSSITHESRNPTLTEAQIEHYLTTYLGITQFIWLDGVYGLETTDMHIDGFVKMVDEHTIVTMNQADLLYWDVPATDIDVLYNATNAQGEAYQFIQLPLTQNNVVTLYGRDLGYKGSYVNYYVANEVVLVPEYNDPNDSVAINILKTVYPTRRVVGIDCRNLYEYGGMIHCVTQQQPVSNVTGLQDQWQASAMLGQNSPNPFQGLSTIPLNTNPGDEVCLHIYDAFGRELKTMLPAPGARSVVVNAAELESGLYFYSLSINGRVVGTKKMLVSK